jgi:hypothetical protein
MNPKAKKRALLNGRATYAGEGELNQYLRQLGWTQKQFCEYAGIHPSAFTRWRGHPLARWPIHLAELVLRMWNMEAWLKTKNYTEEWINEHFGPIELPPMPTGRYPRKPGQLLIDGKPLAEWSPWKTYTNRKPAS